MPRVSKKDNNKENNIYGDDNQLILEPTMDFVLKRIFGRIVYMYEFYDILQLLSIC